MNVFYEEDGGFKVGAIMSESEASLQVEAASGKRSKIKAAAVLLRFDKIGLNDFLPQAQTVADGLDLDFLWECSGGEEFGFMDLAREYYGAAPSPTEAAAMAIRLHSAPMYFYRKGKGRYKAAPEDNLKAAKAGQERKQRETAQIEQWSQALLAGELPEPIRAQQRMLLHRPDKNTIEWKAVALAAENAQLSPLRLLARCGAIPDIEAYFLDGFLTEYFPKGTGFPAIELPPPPSGLLNADVVAFSIDDSATTEIDDAFSVVRLDNGNWRVGVHIAAPTLGVEAGSALEQVVLQRLSTVYMPGNKITMLPDAVVEAFTLAEGRDCAALSLYLEVSPEFEPLGHHSRVERVHIGANLRHDAIEPFFNEQSVKEPESGPDYPYKQELLLLWRLANRLEEKRGKADPNRVERLDYSFRIDTDATGQRHVAIEPRRRGSPMDKLVAELMIYVNSEWGKLLAEQGVAAIYRAQNAGRVRMTTQPAPHVGLGVAQYAWASSPLRRAVDFINQQQLVALLDAETPRYARNDPMLFAAMRDFDQTYNAYADFQAKMERYWCLRWLEQENISEPTATVLKENLVRFDGLPLVARIAGLPELPRGTPVRLQRVGIDYLDLALECRLLSAGEPVALLPDEEEELSANEEAEAAAEAAETELASAATDTPPEAA
ncbi:ribonuclease catalytic domain-containing protein [Chitinimonas lacunae]|uniref:Ribonuclease catalytic domain-containing protein n=1 Tax=Chitinimonas lacunae TaxID=1963018 RepID=A0ABV8MPZ8_9NEIS